MRRIPRSFWSGTGAGFAFVLVELTARAAYAVPTLPELIQDRLVLWLPGPVFAFLLQRLLYLGKPLLFGGLLCGLVVLGGLGGLALARWHRHAALAIALWLLTGLVLLPLAGAGVFGSSVAVATVNLVAFLVYALAYRFFAAPGAWASGPSPEMRGEFEAQEPAPDVERLDGRRLFIGGLLGLAAASLASRAIGRLPELPPRSAAGASPGGVAPAAPVPPDSGAGSPVPGLPPVVTPADRFYVVSKNLLDPRVDANKWRLRVDGLVSRPLSLGHGDLLEMPTVTEYRTLECISNEVGGDLISNGRWTGVRMADLLQRVGVQPGVVAIQFSSADGYTANLSLAQALDPSTLLVHRLNDQALSYKHGFPTRVLATAIYGMKNPKWVTRMELVRSPKPGFWQQQGWDEQGIVQTMAEIDTPNDGAAVPQAGATLGGIAFAGARGIARVEVSTDAGTTWSDAQLLPSLGPNTWSFWQYGWQAPSPGSYTLVVRATDGTGAVQTARRTDPFPVGATGLHQVKVRVAV